MKKFLAILLSVIMLFTLGVAAFAEDDAEEPKEMPANTGKQAEKIVLSLDNTYIEASTDYSIPIRLYADYLNQIPEDAEKIFIGAGGINLLGEMSTDYATRTAIRFSDAIPEENRIEASIDPDSFDGYFAFSIDKKDFNTMLSTSDEGIVVGYVDISVNDKLPTNYGYDFGQLGLFPQYDFSWTIGDQYPNAYGSVGYVDGEGNFTAIETPGTPDDSVVFDTACFYHKPHVKTWKERLKDWAKAQGLLFIGFFITVLNVLEELLKKA